MNIVDAITNERDMIVFHDYLRRHLDPPNDSRYSDFWSVGVNTALRVSEVLAIRYSDIDFKNRILIVNSLKKRKAEKFEIPINDKLFEVLRRRQMNNPCKKYLFESPTIRKKGEITPSKPVTRQLISDAFSKAGRHMKLNINTHSMRKTRGWVMYSNGEPLEVICGALRHKNVEATMRYLGISQRTVKDTFIQYAI